MSNSVATVRLVEPLHPTSDNLRGLVNELDERLAATRSSRISNPDGIEIISSEAETDKWVGLVRDLDDKLASTRQRPISNPDGIEIIRERRVPGWLGIALVLVLGLGIGTAVVRPWQDRCTYGAELCAVAELDIDALRITIPNSELIAVLPDIDALDPNDELTAGDIFAMERFAHLNLVELLTQDDIDRLLSTSG